MTYRELFEEEHFVEFNDYLNEKWIGPMVDRPGMISDVFDVDQTPDQFRMPLSVGPDGWQHVPQASTLISRTSLSDMDVADRYAGGVYTTNTISSTGFIHIGENIRSS